MRAGSYWIFVPGPGFLCSSSSETNKIRFDVATKYVGARVDTKNVLLRG